MNNEMSRYTCQLPLNGFGIQGQDKLKKGKVLIVGLGGLGCPVSQYLAAAGIGTLGLADFDTVSPRNLHRQTLYGDKDVGKLKTEIATTRLKQQNTNIKIVMHPEKIITKNVLNIIRPYDIVVDCTDNFDTRYLLNDACVIKGKPLVYGAILQYEGQAAIWNVKNSKGAFSSNYRDIFPSVSSAFIPTCDTGGVIPTIAGIIGCVQATEVIKYLVGVRENLANRLFIFNAKTMSSYVVSLPKVTKTNISSLSQEIKIPTITVNDLKKGLTKREYSLVDVRSYEEHKDFNIGGKNIPLEKLTQNISQFNFKKSTVLYCKTGIRSAAAVSSLLQINPQAKVMSLEGGIMAWR
jgi:adenylyltransferase/sulfurtransferase